MSEAQVCLRCGELYRSSDGQRHCKCVHPVPSEDGETAMYRRTDNWRRDEYLAAVGVPLLRHEPWCGDDPCICSHGAIRLNDPRPALVEEAVERYCMANMGTVGKFFRKMGLNIG